MKTILIKFGEIALKGQNRPIFEDKLVANIKQRLREFNISVEKEQGRIYIKNISDNEYNKIVERLKKVFGIVGFTLCEVADKDIESIKKAAEVVLQSQYEKDKKTFKVESRRGDKSFPYTSPEISKLVGAHLIKNYKDRLNISVDVHNPDFVLEIEVRDKVYLYAEQYKGIGGMPLGTNGKAHLLLSGGIDSPVAGFLVAKRGVELEAIHFFSFPYTGEKAKEKVIDLCKVLASYTTQIKLHLVPFTEIQTQIYEKCNERYLTIIMRRFMMKISEIIAKSNGGQAIITGESIGQVASQTMESIVCTDNAAQIPVFRPLIGFDKEEIVTISKNIGTYDISILPYEDCCTVFVPKHPKTKPSLLDVIEEEKKLDVEGLINEAYEKTEVLLIR
ncbi:tRNA uracil 4-sulfurtransferase ThiI [Caldicellulosiruptoraceae bacterium PP1]